jgi:hypothetical protein
MVLTFLAFDFDFDFDFVFGLVVGLGGVFADPMRSESVLGQQKRRENPPPTLPLEGAYVSNRSAAYSAVERVRRAARGL